MKYKALISFCGNISMHRNQVRELAEETAQSLVKCGYLEPLEENQKVNTAPTLPAASENETETAQADLQQTEEAENALEPTQQSETLQAEQPVQAEEETPAQQEKPKTSKTKK